MKTYLLYLLGLFAAVPVLYGQSPMQDLRGQIIISERKNEIGVRSLIVVDRDDAIHEIDIGLQHSSGPVISANLGARIARSGNMEIDRFLPKGKVAVSARRFTLEGGDVLHVIVGWGHSSVVQSLQPQCNIYVYREHKAAFTEIFSEELGDELNQFIIEDVNHDGKPEIIVTATSGAYQQMYIWQIQSTGNIAEIQRIDGYEVHTLAPRFLGSDTGIFVAHKSQSPAAGNLCFDTEEYLWSRRQKKFVKDSR